MGNDEETAGSPDRPTPYERNQTLMNTIQLPKNFKNLGKRLPRANYDGNLHKKLQNRKSQAKLDNNSVDMIN